MAFHPTTEKPLVFAGDKMGNLGICDAAQKGPEIKVEDDEDEEDTEARIPSISTLKIHTRTISAFQFHPTDPNKLYSASYDSSIRATDLAKGVAVEVYAPADTSADDPLSGIDMSPLDPHNIFFTTLDGKLGRHDLRAKPSSSATETFQLSEKKIGGFSLHPQHPHLLATASLDRTLKLWDLRKMSGRGDARRPALLGEHESKLSVSHAAFNAAGQVATSSYDDTVKIYDFGGAGAWKASEELAEEKMKPATIVPHNNQTGRWVTM
jgi:WD repeat-containing protein 76